MQHKLEDFVQTKHTELNINATLGEVINEMMQNASGIVVFIQNKIPIGIITEREALKLSFSNISLNDSLTKHFEPKKPITINKDRGSEYALHVLLDNRIRRLVVVDENNTFIGIVSQETLMEHLENSVYKTNMQISSFTHEQKLIISIDENQSIHHTINLMFQKNIGSVVIIDSNKIPIGIFTEKDGLKIDSSINKEKEPIKNHMSSPLITITHTTFIEDAVKVMREHNINRILIEDENKIPHYILSLRDITKSLQGNYEKLLESKLKTLKESLNLIGEYIFEVYEDKGDYIIQWMNDKAINKIGNFLDMPVTNIINQHVWELIYHNLQYTNIINNYKVNIQNMHFEVSCSNHFVNDKETLLFVLKDITNSENEIAKIKQLNNELHVEISMLKNVIDVQQNIVFISDGKQIIHANKSFLSFFAATNLVQFQKNIGCISEKFIEHGDYYFPTKYTKSWIEEILSLAPHKRIITLFNVNTLEPTIFMVNIINIQEKSNQFVISLEDITEKQFDDSKFYYNSTHDTMTKAYNRSYIHHSLEDEINRAKRYHNVFSLVRFNIDNLEKINDTLGYIEGDQIIEKVIDIVIKNIRTSDLVARFDSDDFLILLTETSANKCELVCQNLKQAIQTLDKESDSTVSLSFGYTQFHISDNVRTILERTSKALYQAKEAGKNRYVSL